MLLHRLLLLSSLLVVTLCSPISYQKVQFVVGDESAVKFKPTRTKTAGTSRNSRSFRYPQSYSSGIDIWPSDVFYPPPSVVFYDISFERGHISPDFSNGLDYPDPLLLRGRDAVAAVKYLYGRGELFYHQYPHVRALLRNQGERRANGLEGHFLSSNRPGSPFYRY